MATATAEKPEVREDFTADFHEDEVEAREAYEYWGYFFKADKTGTDKLKSLLRGLKNKVNEEYERSDNPDLTPTQLAHFYRELQGNYDQLFLGTPSTAIAFIYKSLGCLHSLQPLPHSAYTEPTIPALKTEGWIMWQTIQILLGPEEHAAFLREAVARWDVKDPRSGELFPKLLPRECFPAEPDRHMVSWYEGVSERLRKEAEDEEVKQRQIEQADAEHNRLKIRTEDASDDEGSHDSRAALAYFRNPLYRHVDGRPSIVRKNSKRPGLSPRQTMVDKGKLAATTVGHVVRNIASPSLWDGGHNSSGSRDRDREKRRRSLPHHYSNESPPKDYFDRPTSRHHSTHHSRRPSAARADSPRSHSPSIASPRPQHVRQHSHLRPSKSYEPAPSPGGYFPAFSPSSPQPQEARRNSAYDASPNPPTINTDTSHHSPSPGFGPSFGPSQSPLFASHIARQPQPTVPHSNSYFPIPQQSHSRPDHRDDSHHRDKDRDRERERHHPSHSHSHSRHDSEAPHSRQDSHSRPRSRHHPSEETESAPRRHQSMRSSRHGHHHTTSSSGGGGGGKHSGSDLSANRDHSHTWPRDDYDTDATAGSDGHHGRERESRDSRDGRGSGGGARDGRKVTRFVTPAVKGVDGRRYPVV